MTGRDLTYCRGCAHLAFGGSHATDQVEGTCDYLLDTGRSRSAICPAGYGCSEHTKHRGMDGAYAARRSCSRRGKPAPNRKLDPDKARALYDLGLTDRKIARMCGVSAASVNNWRRKNNLPMNWEGKRGKGYEL